MRSIATIVGSVIALGILASPLHAAVPSPANSTVDPCLVICPGGDISFTVVVRDFGNNPVANSTVQVDFCNCPNVHLCPTPPGGPPSVTGIPCFVSKVTNAAGAVTFNIKGGGTCLNSARVFADGILLANRSVASPDQDGSLMVDFADDAILLTKIGSGDPTGDLDCDGTVTNNDRLVLAGHLGHSCDTITSARPSSWGRLKTIYR